LAFLPAAKNSGMLMEVRTASETGMSGVCSGEKISAKPVVRFAPMT